MSNIIQSIEGEYRRYKSLSEGAIAQVSDADLNARPIATGNSIATIMTHVAGNLESRFSDFLTSDGEKPWRDREREFAHGDVSRPDLLTRWEQGWSVLFATLATLTDTDGGKTVTIRGQPLLVHEALHRSLAHAAYHTGQIVDRAHALSGADWRHLSIPPGGTAAYNANPIFEKPTTAALRFLPPSPTRP
jgi:uncharacterized damage-inducible protein DinB